MKKIEYSLGGENILPEITATARIIKKPEATQLLLQKYIIQLEKL